MYYPIIMPVDKDGHGPAPDDEFVKITYEVWDQLCMSFGSHDYLLDAVEQAEQLNHEYHNQGIMKAHQPDLRDRMLEQDDG